ncbi:MAG: hypothetical protein HY872_09220 [Chloroflexi bacterium]|nr:hypothetical protein [Chloroflexota bacterium]
MELFGNSAQFPIANILFEVLREGLAGYVRAPDPYTILLVSVVQAYWLSRWQTTAHPRRFIGNLIGPAVYTVIEAAIEGPRFFSAPHHLAYWGFALVIGALQSFRGDRFGWLASTLRVLEDVVRAGILLVMYTLYEMATNPVQTTSWGAFFADSSHQFVSLATLLLGLSLGLSSLTAQRYLDLLRQTSARLKMYSEWLLGRDLLGSAEVKFYDVIGDTVNTAKRIEGNAGPAEVLASQAIHGSLAEAFRFGPMREVEAKGKDLPLAVYPLEGAAG